MMRKKLENSRLHIIQTAFGLFLKHGYRNVSIQNIVDATQLSKGAIYHHFTSKDDIFYATLETYYFKLSTVNLEARSTGNFKSDLTNAYTFVAQIFDNVEKLTPTGIDYPIRSFYLYQLEAELHEKVTERMKTVITAYIDQTKKTVVHAQQTGQIHAHLDPDLIALKIIVLIRGTSMLFFSTKRNAAQLLLQKFKLIFDDFFKNVEVKKPNE